MPFMPSHRPRTVYIHGRRHRGDCPPQNVSWGGRRCLYPPQYFINIIIYCHRIFQSTVFLVFAAQQNLTYAARQLPQTKISFSKIKTILRLVDVVFPRMVSRHIFGVYFEIMLHLFTNQAWDFPVIIALVVWLTFLWWRLDENFWQDIYCPLHNSTTQTALGGL